MATISCQVKAWNKFLLHISKLCSKRQFPSRQLVVVVPLCHTKYQKYNIECYNKNQQLTFFDTKYMYKSGSKVEWGFSKVLYSINPYPLPILIFRTKKLF